MLSVEGRIRQTTFKCWEGALGLILFQIEGRPGGGGDWAVLGRAGGREGGLCDYSQVLQLWNGLEMYEAGE